MFPTKSEQQRAMIGQVEESVYSAFIDRLNTFVRQSFFKARNRSLIAIGVFIPLYLLLVILTMSDLIPGAYIVWPMVVFVPLGLYAVFVAIFTYTCKLRVAQNRLHLLRQMVQDANRDTFRPADREITFFTTEEITPILVVGPYPPPPMPTFGMPGFGGIVGFGAGGMHAYGAMPGYGVGGLPGGPQMAVGDAYAFQSGMQVGGPQMAVGAGYAFPQMSGMQGGALQMTVGAGYAFPQVGGAVPMTGAPLATAPEAVPPATNPDLEMEVLAGEEVHVNAGASAPPIDIGDADKL